MEKDKDKKLTDEEKKKRDDEKKKHDDELLDEGLDETFPASDPPSHSRPNKRDE